MYLFVYGTLLRSINHKMGRYLNTNGTFIGKAKVQGLLYDLGNYPGLVKSTNKEDCVFGEIFQFENDQVLQVLDEYEGIGPLFPIPNEYRREKIEASLSDRNTLTCWSYILNHAILKEPLITSGDYSAYIKTKPKQ